MRRSPEVVLSMLTLVMMRAGVLAEEPAKKADAVKPPWQRLLQGENVKKATEQEKQLEQFQEVGKFVEALKVAESLTELRTREQGADHWEVVNARWTVAALHCALVQPPDMRKEYASIFALSRQAIGLESKGRSKEAQPLKKKILALRRKVLGEEHPDTAISYNSVAYNLNAQGKYRQAEEGYRKALAIFRKALGEEHPSTANGYDNLAFSLNAQGKHAEAEKDFRKALAIRLQVLGEEHADTALGYNNVAYNQAMQGKYQEAEKGYRKALSIYRKLLGEEHLDTALGYNNVAYNLQDQGKYAEAEEGLRKALSIRLKVLGEEHADTAFSYNNVAYNQAMQGKYQEAEKGYRKALVIFRKVLGEAHPVTATSYSNVAANLQDQGKYAEAEESLRKALSIRLKALGEEHADTARSYNNVAYNLNAQGKYKEAEAGYRKALFIHRKVLGEEHADTALSYNNLAYNQNAQGKYKEAEEGYRKALTIFRKVLGEEHPQTALSYNNVALNLDAQGKYAEAEKGLGRALVIRRNVLGEEHPDTALSYNNVAYNQSSQGKYAEAEEGYRKALSIRRKMLGEEHPDTAQSYSNVSANLKDQGKYAEAEEGYRKSLTIRRKVLGKEHPDTAASYNNLALNQYAQGKFDEAENLYRRAADSFAKTRLHIAASGLERATITSELSPLPALAAVLARNGKPDDAWQRFEESLARGTWDDLSARLARPQTERDKQAQITARIDRLQKLLEATNSVKLTPEQTKQREERLTQLRQAYDDLVAFTHELETKYGPIAGEIFSCARIQKSLPADAAFIAWLDVPGRPKAKDPHGEHWAILLRSTGNPIWVRLHGSGAQGAWTDADKQLPAKCREVLQSSRGLWQPLTERLRKQRLDPLAQHLKGMRHLIVLPSTALAGVPVEVFAEGYTVSYAHSGTMSTYLRQQKAPTGTGLLALADPVFEAPTHEEKSQALPPSGVLLTMVLPGSNAARAGLKPNDVLLRYGDTDLAGPADFKPLPSSDDPDKKVAVIVWREGERRKQPFYVPAGKLGVVIAQAPAPQALAEQRRWDRKLVSAQRGNDGEWKRLPGTRIEVASLRPLFEKDSAIKVLLDSDASEQRLNELAQSGELGKYRYLHLATHGEVDNVMPLRSAVILSRDKLPDDQQRTELLLAGQPIADGRLTADEALRLWNLHCDLVTLSACQTALGKYERGEGYVGFAQALILCGTRSVCLSLWKVNDTATALLMTRLYQNLLGQREGLSKPMAKAAALAEAKEWLRTLPLDEAVKRAASITDSAERGKQAGSSTAKHESFLSRTKEQRPFAHPYYWAAFVLIGHAD